MTPEPIERLLSKWKIASRTQAQRLVHEGRVRAAGIGRSLLADAMGGFPRELRKNSGFFALACLLFYGPFVLGLLGALGSPDFAARILPESQLAGMEQMYAGPMSRGNVGADAGMAGFYVWNNVGIAFRVFATGVFFGLGPLFYLSYNGLVIGTVFGYVASAGHGANIGTFAVGHGPWELTGICVSGAAGLRLGWALIATGGRTRLGSVVDAGPSIYRLVLGVAVMLLVAAAIEGFWSAGPAPAVVKYVFGLVQLVVVVAWIVFGGRRAGET